LGPFRVFPFERAAGAVRKRRMEAMDDVRAAVRETYGNIASKGASGGCCGGSSCGGTSAGSVSSGLGYGEAELAALPEGADLGLGCGNPQAIAFLEPGETVLDLGSGGGIDAFLAGQQVGPTGRVIGVDMTPEMLSRARKAAQKVGVANVEFRLGEIEHLPVADESIDVILSNCVINLSPEKPAVFREAYRVLKPGGRLAISDMVATAPLADAVKSDRNAYTGCVGGAATFAELESMLVEAGFVEVRVRPKSGTPSPEALVVSATIEAKRPQRS
jgi:SAM-dependent methyltransferase